MNILYISSLSNNVDSGLSWSVPACVKAQQKLDNVFWINITKGTFQSHWGEVEAYHNVAEFGKKLSLSLLPLPFSSPDLVVFEGFYDPKHVFLAKKLLKKKIPYIIVPRGSLTHTAINSGGWKKVIKRKIGNLLLFKWYKNHATSIQFLTTGERKNSGNLSTASFVLPNGFTLPPVYKERFSDGIKMVYIGRLDIYTKGLDLLLCAIHDLKDELVKAKFHLDMYGAPRSDADKLSKTIQDLHLNNLVTNHNRIIKGEEKHNVLLDSDVFVLTSRTEGHPMGLVEALAYGLPALVSKGTNMSDEIDAYKAGWTSDVSVESIKLAMKKMISDKNHFSTFAKNARELSLLYSWDKLAEQFHFEIEKIMNK